MCFYFTTAMIKTTTTMTMHPPGPYVVSTHLVVAFRGASHEATDTLHWVMCLALYLPGGMVVAIAVESVN